MTDFKTDKIDVIVVGAGPAGLSAALSVKRAGKSVVVLERAEISGQKNMFGGAVYLKSLKSILPETYMTAPFERFISKHQFSFLTDTSSVDINSSSFLNGADFSQNDDENKLIKKYNEELLKKASGATVLRPKFDKWLMEEAKKEGVFVAPRTLVKKLLIKNGAVIGVQTEEEKYFASVVILADGVNSLLAREAGLRREFFPKDMFLSVKETYKMDKSLMEERFYLKKGTKEGKVIEFFGGLSEFYEKTIQKKAGQKVKEFITPFAIGFLYTFEGQISIGLGVSLEDLADYRVKPYELLEKLKEHPAVKGLLTGAEFQEYSAHMIPEGGWKNLPKLCGNGVLLAGDAAGFVNAAHFEGTNFAIESGKLAGEAAASAVCGGNFSKSALKIYEDKLRESFVLKDLKAYRSVVENLAKRKKSVLYYYPKKMREFMDIVTNADNIPKKKKIWAFILSFFKERSLISLMRDFKAFLTIFFELIF